MKFIKQLFWKVVDWVKEWGILFIGPIGFIIKYWKNITGFFSGLWKKVASMFTSFITYIRSIPSMMFEAGKNIVKSIWEGIKSFADRPVEAIKKMVKKIRDFLPFSPAKEGALKDIHKIRLVETISENIKPKPMVDAMRRTMAATFVATSTAIASPKAIAMNAPASNSNAGGITIHFNPQITISDGGALSPDAAAQFNDIFSRQQRDLIKLLEDYKRNKERTKF
jgi:hypothetical protein